MDLGQEVQDLGSPYLCCPTCWESSEQGWATGTTGSSRGRGGRCSRASGLTGARGGWGGGGGGGLWNAQPLSALPSAPGLASDGAGTQSIRSLCLIGLGFGLWRGRLCLHNRACDITLPPAVMSEPPQWVFPDRWPGMGGPGMGGARAPATQSCFESRPCRARQAAALASQMAAKKKKKSTFLFLRVDA